MRRPQDQLSQQRLVIELKIALDRGDARAVRSLVESNPRSAHAGHVRYNLGVRRRRQLDEILKETPVG